jgi:hypothetical protein
MGFNTRWLLLALAKVARVAINYMCSLGDIYPERLLAGGPGAEEQRKQISEASWKTKWG